MYGSQYREKSSMILCQNDAISLADQRAPALPKPLRGGRVRGKETGGKGMACATYL